MPMVGVVVDQIFNICIVDGVDVMLIICNLPWVIFLWGDLKVM
jgi:hypothetical protein